MARLCSNSSFSMFSVPILRPGNAFGPDNVRCVKVTLYDRTKLTTSAQLNNSKGAYRGAEFRVTALEDSK